MVEHAVTTTRVVVVVVTCSKQRFRVLLLFCVSHSFTTQQVPEFCKAKQYMIKIKQKL